MKTVLALKCWQPKRWNRRNVLGGREEWLSYDMLQAHLFVPYCGHHRNIFGKIVNAVRVVTWWTRMGMACFCGAYGKRHVLDIGLSLLGSHRIVELFLCSSYREFFNLILLLPRQILILQGLQGKNIFLGLGCRHKSPCGLQRLNLLLRVHKYSRAVWPSTWLMWPWLYSYRN